MATGLGCFTLSSKSKQKQHLGVRFLFVAEGGSGDKKDREGSPDTSRDPAKWGVSGSDSCATNYLAVAWLFATVCRRPHFTGWLNVCCSPHAFHYTRMAGRAINTIAVTGSSGDVGSQVVSFLLAQNPPCKVIAIDITPPPPSSTPLPPGSRFIRADFTKLDQVKSSLVGADAVIQLAGYPRPAACMGIKDLTAEECHNVNVSISYSKFPFLSFAYQSIVADCELFGRCLIGSCFHGHPTNCYCFLSMCYWD